jgi:hypothetical protein
VSEIVEPPVPLSQGTYALFETPNGGLHLVYHPKGAADDIHLEIPAFVVKLANQAASGHGGPDISKLLGGLAGA